MRRTVSNRHTHTHTDPTTVTLAAHARRGPTALQVYGNIRIWRISLVLQKDIAKAGAFYGSPDRDRRRNAHARTARIIVVRAHTTHTARARAGPKCHFYFFFIIKATRKVTPGSLRERCFPPHLVHQAHLPAHHTPITQGSTQTNKQRCQSSIFL